MEAFHFPEAMQNNFILYPLSRIVSTSNRTKTILTIRERTALRHQRNHHWVNYLKTLHILNHPTPPPFFLLSRTNPGNNIWIQSHSTPSLPVESPEGRFLNHHKLDLLLFHQASSTLLCTNQCCCKLHIFTVYLHSLFRSPF